VHPHSAPAFYTRTGATHSLSVVPIASLQRLDHCGVLVDTRRSLATIAYTTPHPHLPSNVHRYTPHCAFDPSLVYDENHFGTPGLRLDRLHDDNLLRFCLRRSDYREGTKAGHRAHREEATHPALRRVHRVSGTYGVCAEGGEGGRFDVYGLSSDTD
jgi:hypothetical protein